MRAAVAAIALALLAGCATVPPPSPPRAAQPAGATQPPATQPSGASGVPPTSPPAASPASGAQVGSTASGGSIRVNAAPAAPAPAAVDSAPSPDAIRVLSTIPEPIAGAISAPAPPMPEVAPADMAGSAAGAPGDTTSAPAVVDSSSPDSTADAAVDSAGVPIPEPTTPLGDRPGSLAKAALPETLAAPAAPAPGPAPAVGTTPTSPDSCWRVQVVAPPERERAERLAEAARSQLMVPMVVEREAGLYKVRTRDCMNAVAADDLKRRAIATGFEGAFRFPRKKP